MCLNKKKLIRTLPTNFSHTRVLFLYCDIEVRSKLDISKYEESYTLNTSTLVYCMNEKLLKTIFLILLN